jgi:hypothetical protein
MRYLLLRILLLAALVAALELAGCGSSSLPRPAGATQSHATSGAAAPRRSQPGQAQPTPSADQEDDDDPEPHAARSQVSAARALAVAFLRSYVSYLYGQAPASRVPGVDEAVRQQIERGRATITPAERASHPRIARLLLASSGPPVSVVATAVIRTGASQLSPFTATLEPRGRGWVVVAVSG